MKFLNRIMNLFKRIKRLWQESALKYRYNELADTEDFWLPEDALKVSEFFASTTGQKLRARLTNFVLQSAMTATRENTQRDIGVARGVALTVSAIEQHFASPLRNEDNSEYQQPSSVEADLALN